MTKLSICIFAYNQIGLIKEQLDEILTYPGSDVEFVVSDDTTDDSIKELIESYGDNRVRYVRNTIGAGADGNYLNALMHASSDYAWIFRSADRAIPDKISDVIKVIENDSECALYFPSSERGNGLKVRKFADEKNDIIWRSGTLHPSGYVVNKKYCDFGLYKQYIEKYFADYKTSNVAFILQLADLSLKGDVLYSSIEAWKYADTLARTDKAMNAPGGKNPFGLEFEYRRYELMLDYASKITDEPRRVEFTRLVIHTFAKQILHVFGKRNSSKAFLSHYGCDSVPFNPIEERKTFESNSLLALERLKINISPYKMYIKKEAFVYGVVKPFIYKIKNK